MWWLDTTRGSMCVVCTGSYASDTLDASGMDSCLQHSFCKYCYSGSYKSTGLCTNRCITFRGARGNKR